jgi:hypothetical protein
MRGGGAMQELKRCVGNRAVPQVWATLSLVGCCNTQCNITHMSIVTTRWPPFSILELTVS